MHEWCAGLAGAAIVCHGPCSVIFDSCALKGCPIVASGGANITLSNTNCSSTSCGVFVQGPGSKLTLNVGTFSQLHQVCAARDDV
jgi:hypothetical protein